MLEHQRTTEHPLNEATIFGDPFAFIFFDNFCAKVVGGIQFACSSFINEIFADN